MTRAHGYSILGYMGTNKKVRISDEMYEKLKEKSYKEDRAISQIVDEALGSMFEDVPFKHMAPDPALGDKP